MHAKGTRGHSVNASRDATLRDTHVLIRRLRAADARQLFEAVSESIIPLSTWMTWCPQDYTFQHCRSFIQRAGRNWARDREYTFAICSLEPKTIIGSVGINQIDRTHNVANLGYWVRSSQTGQGFAARAVKLAAQFAFDSLNLARLEIVIPCRNLASHRTAEKAGAAYEGLLRNKVVLLGQSHDATMYSLIRADI